MSRVIAIQPTYFGTVERLLFQAGSLDLVVKFTDADASYPVPFITEVTVNEGKSDDVVERVRQALAPIAKASE